MKAGNSILSGFGTTIFTVMSALAEEHKAVNLGQGFPDDRGPEDVLAEAARALVEDSNQYPPMMGTPRLRQAVAAHGRRFYGLDVDWQREVMVTHGATEAIAATILGLINPGDEVVLFQPMYDSYLPLVRLAGGVPKFVTLKPPAWGFSQADLEAAFSPRTKLVIVNDPLNPAAKVFDRGELELIAELAISHDAYVMCDEAYEHLLFGGRPHIPLITLPGMRERCVKIGSAGKTFSLTGWKIGTITAAPALLQPIAKAHQFLTFTSPPNLQAGVAYGLGKDDAYFRELAGGLEAKRHRLAAGLKRVGFDVMPTAGTYFIVADFRPLGFAGDDDAFCRHMVAEAGVAAIPLSAFYAENAVTHCVRFCFSKQDAILDEAVARLEGHFGRR
ncbi:MAG TPA: aminotransferase [Azospirillaceae bacterium]|nr:aminotransferase [Azospirillaceae bacterium]